MSTHPGRHGVVGGKDTQKSGRRSIRAESRCTDMQQDDVLSLTFFSAAQLLP